ncbi:metallophosphoesterase [uncultured Eubacterium sp.]|uniref:metallophosphoesterase family protein n=1 Tax=uncultured Eubacterium sp. TaxID=165185 RepID=UPI002593B2C7|nr:metallophosphoesterase [uncultured Eubacterium sp.]
MDKIHWLHLSDIHLNKRDVDSRRMRNRLLDYMKELGTQIDYIFITGDLRYAPMGEFAADTVDYINKLLSVTNLTVDRLFIVPGNHDIERDAEGRAEAILESIKEYSPKDGALASDKMAAVHCGHTEFRKMMHRIYHENQEQAASYDDDEKPHFVTETKDFNIICIDTALTYTKQRNDNLFIGTEYIMDLLEELNQDKPSIILTHYSFDFLERSEQMQIVQLLKDFHVQLWLAGHEHTVLMRKQWDYFYEFQSGNLMHEGEYTRSTIMIGTYDSASYNGIVEVHEWDSDNGWFKMQNVGVHKEDYYAYELQNTKTMIDQIVSASHQNAGSPVQMEAELSAVSDKMEMDTVCGELSAAEDIHQMPSEISSGYLYVDNRIAPAAQVEVLEYNIYGTKYYEIRNDGFEFKFLESRISIPPLYTQQFEIENLSFGYELSVYSNVADRLFWFNVISEIVNASTIIIKFGAADKERILRMSIPGAGSSFDRIREETAVWKEQMERITKIENYYGVKFYLPKKADESVYVTIAILSDAIEGLPTRRLPVVNMKSRGLFKHFTLNEEVWYGDGSDLMSLNLFGYTFKPVAEYIMPGEFVWNRKEHGWESDKKNGGVSVRVEFMIDTDISKDKKLMDVMPVSDLKDELNLEETPIVTGECADIISDYINVSHKVQEIYRQYQMYQEALGEWIHYDLDEDNHLVKKYSGAVIDKVTVNKMTKNILHEGMLLVRKAGAFVQKLGLQNETDFLTDSVGDNLGFQFMVLAAIYMDHGHWAVEFEKGDSFYNLLEMCTVLRTVDEEDSADLLETFTLLKNEMEEQGMDIRHIDHYNMLRNYIYTVADIYKIFFDTIQKKLEAMVGEIDSLVDKNPDFIATEGKFKDCIFYQTDTDANSVDVFDPSGNIMADFSIFQSEAIRNYEKTRLGIQAGDPCS